jgi:hypothetical protein
MMNCGADPHKVIIISARPRTRKRDPYIEETLEMAAQQRISARYANRATQQILPYTGARLTPHFHFEARHVREMLEIVCDHGHPMGNRV